MWKAIGKAYWWKHPKVSSVKRLWNDKTTEAVLVIPRDTRVGYIVTVRRFPREEEGEDDGNEEGGPGPP